MLNLLSREEYIEKLKQGKLARRYSEPKFTCPRCGGPVRQDLKEYVEDRDKFVYKCDFCIYQEVT